MARWRAEPTQPFLMFGYKHLYLALLARERIDIRDFAEEVGRHLDGVDVVIVALATPSVNVGPMRPTILRYLR